MTAVTPPSSATNAPHHQAGVPSRSNTMRTKPYTATLVMTPLISAETWLGAAGCASGSHTCSGTMPAFEPAPISARVSTPAAISAPGGGAAEMEHRQEEGCQRVEAEMRAEPRQPEGQRQRSAERVGDEERAAGKEERERRRRERDAVDHPECCSPMRYRDGHHAGGHKRSNAPQQPLQSQGF